ncbi:MAG: phosphoenolpyruvate--protein phosphotransferase [Spirochaetota bacterium]
MVGIVVVAHSARLAEAVESLARHMLREQVPIATAGGVDDPEHPYGTDPLAIKEAVERVYGEDGVVVLMDMGSAVLSAETALDLLPEEMRAKVRLCEAPVVEGAVSAAVRSEGGGTLEEVLEEARGALGPKTAQLGGPREEERPGGEEAGLVTPAAAAQAGAVGPRRSEAGPAEDREAPPSSVVLQVTNRLGVHARPAARFVSTASRFASEITVGNLSRNAGPVSARSINLVSTLGIRRGHRIQVTARGPDAGEALEALAALVQRGFEEPEAGAARESPPAGGQDTGTGKPREEPEALAPGARGGGPGPLPGKALRGIPASPGIAVGPARLYRPGASHPREESSRDGPPPKEGSREGRSRGDAQPPAAQAPVRDPSRELERLGGAIAQTETDLRRTRDRVCSQAGETAAGLLDAQLLSLRDPALQEAAERAVREESKDAATAWHGAVQQMVRSYRSLDDPYLAARAADLEGLEAQVLLHLEGREKAAFALEEPAVLAAGELTPADLARVDLGMLLGVCTAFGGATSHGAILARSAGIPAVMGLGPEILRVVDGTVLAVDGGEGTVLVDPPDRGELLARQEAWKAERDRALLAARRPAVTRDGVRVTVEANLGEARETGYALRAGAERVGVLRTEFLFLDRDRPPSEEEQVETYRGIAGDLEGLPLTVRLLDAGGDKPLPYLDLRREANPYLGVRGVRLLLDAPDLLEAQLRAVLRAGAGFPLRLLVPMVSSVGEVRRIREMLAVQEERLREEGLPFAERLAVGVMIEVPAAALDAGLLAGEADFFSIGTNDLAQYVMAAERGNPRVSGLCDALHPAVLRLVAGTASAGERAGIPVAVCGEVAGDPKAVPVLLGLGVRELSMNPSSIPPVKETIARLRIPDTRRLADQALEAESADQVREAVDAMW